MSTQMTILKKAVVISLLSFCGIFLMLNWLAKTEASLTYGQEGENPGFEIIGVAHQGDDRLYEVSGSVTDQEVVGSGDVFGLFGGTIDPLWYKFAVFIELPRKLGDVIVNKADAFPTGDSSMIKFSRATLDEVVGTETHRRFKVQIEAECEMAEVRDIRFTLKLSYFSGEESVAPLNFAPPFVPGEVVPATEDNRNELYLVDGEESKTIGNLDLKLWIVKHPDYDGQPVLAYDTMGKRYLLGHSNAMTGSGTVLNLYDSTALAFGPEELDAVSIGEGPKELLFRNIILRVKAKKFTPATYVTNNMPGVTNLFKLSFGKVGADRVPAPSEAEQETIRRFYRHCDQTKARAAIHYGLLYNVPGAVDAMLDYLIQFPEHMEFTEIADLKGTINPEQAEKLTGLVSGCARLNSFGKISYHRAPSFAAALIRRFADDKDPHYDKLKMIAEKSEPWLWYDAASALVKAGHNYEELSARNEILQGKITSVDALTLLEESLTVELWRVDPQLFFKLADAGLALENNKGVLSALSACLSQIKRRVLHRELIAGILIRLNRKYAKIFGLVGTAPLSELKKRSGGDWYKKFNLARGQAEAIAWLTEITAEQE